MGVGRVVINRGGEYYLILELFLGFFWLKNFVLLLMYKIKNMLISNF